jgi:hypothetical protein
MTLAVLLSGCSSDDNGTVVLDPDVTTTTAPDNLMGIWVGEMAKGIAVYDIVMVFHFPDGAEEGRVVGVAVNQQTDLPYLLIDSGYMAVDKVAHPNWDFDFLIGSDGSQGTAMKRYAFANKLVSQQSGVSRLYLEDGDVAGDTLTGTVNFEGTGVDNLGEFNIVLKYWDQNTTNNTADLNYLADTWTDPVDDPAPNDGIVEDVGWDDQSVWADLEIASDGTLLSGSVSSSGCAASGPGKVLDVAGHNIFLFGDYTAVVPPRITLDINTCGTRDWNESDLIDAAQIGGVYDGIGMLVNDNGTEKLLMVLTSTTNTDPDTPGNAIFNEFVRK